jgi:hypothetical protein
MHDRVRSPAQALRFEAILCKGVALSRCQGLQAHSLELVVCKPAAGVLVHAAHFCLSEGVALRGRLAAATHRFDITLGKAAPAIPVNDTQIELAQRIALRALAMAATSLRGLSSVRQVPPS